MKKGFITQISSARELQENLNLFVKAGIDTDAITVGNNFDDFANSSSQGDVLVVQSYASVFGSLTCFLNATTKLFERGVYVESLSEPELRVDDETIDYMRSLSRLKYDLHKSKTYEGIMRAKAEGKRLGRPVGTTKVTNKVARIDKLRESQNLTVAEACEKVGCLPRTYYRHKSENKSEKNRKERDS